MGWVLEQDGVLINAGIEVEPVSDAPDDPVPLLLGILKLRSFDHQGGYPVASSGGIAGQGLVGAEEPFLEVQGTIFGHDMFPAYGEPSIADPDMFENRTTHG